MRRRCSFGAVWVPGLLGAAYLTCALGACLSGQDVDLGTDFDSAASVLESGRGTRWVRRPAGCFAG